MKGQMSFASLDKKMRVPPIDEDFRLVNARAPETNLGQ
jgi:hypothetical protein